MAGFVNAGCDKAMFGWPCDAEMEKLRDEFARETDPAKQKEIAEAVQMREHRSHHAHVTSASGISRPPRARTSNGIPTAPAPVFWNVEKEGVASLRAALTRPDRAQRRSGAAAAAGTRGLNMLGYILRRLAATAPVMLIVAVLVFLMLRLTPGDPAAIIAGDNANAEQIAAIRNRLGLDEPIFTQFFIWFGNILRGDFGESFFFKKTVAELIVEPARADAGALARDHRHRGRASRCRSACSPPTSRAR